MASLREDLLALARKHGVPVCDWGDALALEHSDGSAAYWIPLAPPGPAGADALWKDFREMDEARRRVLVGYRHLAFQSGYALRPQPDGRWDVAIGAVRTSIETGEPLSSSIRSMGEVRAFATGAFHLAMGEETAEIFRDAFREIAGKGGGRKSAKSKPAEAKPASLYEDLRRILKDEGDAGALEAIRRRWLSFAQPPEKENAWPEEEESGEMDDDFADLEDVIPDEPLSPEMLRFAAELDAQHALERAPPTADPLPDVDDRIAAECDALASAAVAAYRKSWEDPHYRMSLDDDLLLDDDDWLDREWLTALCTRRVEREGGGAETDHAALVRLGVPGARARAIGWIDDLWREHHDLHDASDYADLFELLHPDSEAARWWFETSGTDMAAVRAGWLPARRHVQLAAAAAIASAREAAPPSDDEAFSEWGGGFAAVLELTGEMRAGWLPRFLSDDERRLVEGIVERGTRWIARSSDQDGVARTADRVLACLRAFDRRDLGAQLLECPRYAKEIAERRPEALVAWSAWMAGHPALRPVAAQALRSGRRKTPPLPAAIAWSRCRHARR